MQCDDCHRDQACIHIKGIGPNGLEIEMKLCAECARKRMMHPDAKDPMQAELQKLLLSSKGELAKLLEQHLGKKVEEMFGLRSTGHVCAQCGVAWDAIAENGLLGCPGCLESFRKELLQQLKAKANSVCQVERLLDVSEDGQAEDAALAPLASQSRQLEQQMAEAAAAERFEEAAEIKNRLEKLRMASRRAVRRLPPTKWGEDSVELFLDADQALRQLPSWLPPEAAMNEGSPLIRLGTAFGLRRNLNGYPLPPSTGHEERLAAAGWKILDLLKTRRLTADLTPFDLETTVSEEGSLAFRPCCWLGWMGEEFALRSGQPRWMLSGAKGRLVVRVNDLNHLELDLWAGDADRMDAMTTILQFARDIDREADWARFRDFGFLTHEVNGLGAGVRPRMALHLPGLALMGQLPQAKAACREFDAELKEWISSASNDTNLFWLERQPGLDVPVLEQLMCLEQVSLKLERVELQCRENLATQWDRKLKLVDAVGRAYGLAREVRLTDIQEARRMLSMLWLGIECGMLPALDRAQVIREIGYFAGRQKPGQEDGQKEGVSLGAASVDAMRLNRLVRRSGN